MQGSREKDLTDLKAVKKKAVKKDTHFDYTK
jgi:hypothetical protein